MINILQFLHFFAFLFYAYLLIFLLWKDPKSLLNRVCAALLACFAVWSFGLVFLFSPNSSKETARLFDNIASIGWIGFSSFFFWFALVFTEKKEIVKKRITYPLIFILPLLLIYQQWTGFLTADYIKHSWGWVSVWSKSIWTYVFYLYYLSFVMGAIYLILDFGRKAKELLKKKQVKIIFITALVSFILSTLTDVVLPELNITRLPSSLGSVIILIWATGLVYAITKYKFMTITPISASEKIISTMADSLVLLDRGGKIVTVNEAMIKLSGYQEDELKGNSIEIFFEEKDFKITLLDKAMKNEAIKNYELNFKTKTTGHVPVIFSGSTMMDEAGSMVGIVCIIKDITERKLTEEKINWLASFPILNPTLVLEIDYKKGLTFINTSAKEIFPDLENKQMDHPFAAGTLKYFRELNTPTLNHQNREIEVDGRWYLQALFLVNPNRLRIYAFDITQRKKNEETLHTMVEMLDTAPSAIFVHDFNGRFLYANRKSSELHGYETDEFMSLNLHQMVAPESEALIAERMQLIKEKGEASFEVAHIRKDGTTFPLDVFVKLVKWHEISAILSINTDITVRKQLEQKLEQAATHDFLTGLPNRILLLDRFSIAVALAQRNKERITIMSLDLDKFKSINDTLGHGAGDQVLKVFSTRLTGIIRASDTLARVGGDEFTLLMPETSQAEGAATIAQKILDSFAEPLLIDSHQLLLSTSIGIAIYPEDAEDLPNLTKKADAAMYYAKGHGRNLFKFFGDGDVWISGDHRSAT